MEWWGGVWWCLVVFGGVWWCLVGSGGVWWGLVVCGGVWWGLVCVGGVWCVLVCVVPIIDVTACPSRRVRVMQLIRVAETPGSKLPASPPPLPRPDGGGTLAVYLCTRPKKRLPVTP